jgi:hypothetical protein
MRFFDVAIECFEVKLKLSKIFRSKFIDFEFKGNEALEFAVIEDEIDEEVTVANLKAIFFSYKSEVSTKF